MALDIEHLVAAIDKDRILPPHIVEYVAANLRSAAGVRSVPGGGNNPARVETPPDSEPKDLTVIAL